MKRACPICDGTDHSVLAATLRWCQTCGATIEHRGRRVLRVYVPREAAKRYRKHFESINSDDPSRPVVWRSPSS